MLLMKSRNYNGKGETAFFQMSRQSYNHIVNFANKLNWSNFQEEDSMFKTYSLKGCQFECKLTNTFKSVGCIPWDYPIPPALGDEENIPICNSSAREDALSSLAEFNLYMDDAKSLESCSQCIPDCEQEVRFETQVSNNFKN